MSVRWAFNFTKWEPSFGDMLLATSCVQKEERERLGRFVFQKDVKSSLIGRLMMRKFVSENCGLKYDQIRFLRDEKGKPFLENKDAFGDINYNVSHQGDFTVLAGCVGDCLLGVDVVKVEFPRSKTLNEYFRIMNRTFSLKEWDTIKAESSDRNKLFMYFRHWCLKESYLKAVGIGVTINLQDVSFKINTNLLKKDVIVNDTEVFFKGDKLIDWKFQEMLLDDDHCVAVATNLKDSDEILFKELDFSEIMDGAVPFSNQDNEYCVNFFKKSNK